MTVLKSFEEEMVSDAGIWRTLEVSAQLWLDSSCCTNDARWWYLGCKRRSRARIGFITMKWWEFRSGGRKESEPAGNRGNTSHCCLLYDSRCFSLPTLSTSNSHRRNYHFQLLTCQLQIPYLRNCSSSDFNAVFNSLSNGNSQCRSNASYARNVLVRFDSTSPCYMAGAAS